MNLEILTRRYGPLPGYAWAGLAGVAAYLVIRHRQAAAAAAAASSPAGSSAADGTGTADGTGYADTSADTGGGSAYEPASYSGPTPTPAPPKVTIGTVKVTVPKGALAPNLKLYVVRRGDTKKTIAGRFHISVTRLEQLNPYLKAHPVHAGETVLV